LHATSEFRIAGRRILNLLQLLRKPAEIMNGPGRSADRYYGVASRHPKGSLQQAPQTQFVAKTLQQHHAPEVSQMGLVKGKLQFSQGSRHDHETRFGKSHLGTQTSLKVNFVSTAA